jgi:Tol biopolymer transport system component
VDSEATGWDIALLPLAAERKPRNIVQAPDHQFGPAISPDGRWLAYVSVESGRPEVFVTSFPSRQGTWRISTDGGGEAVWARNSRELFYREGDKMMAVGIENNSSFTAMKPRKLFLRAKPGRKVPGLSGYDISPDGKRFLMTAESGAAQPSMQLHLVVNWSEELKTRSAGPR